MFSEASHTQWWSSILSLCCYSVWLKKIETRLPLFWFLPCFPPPLTSLSLSLDISSVPSFFLQNKVRNSHETVLSPVFNYKTWFSCLVKFGDETDALSFRYHLSSPPPASTVEGLLKFVLIFLPSEIFLKKLSLPQIQLPSCYFSGSCFCCSHTHCLEFSLDFTFHHLHEKSEKAISIPFFRRSLNCYSAILLFRWDDAAKQLIQ